MKLNMKLTDLKIKKLKSCDKDYTQADGNNLYLRVDKGGNKSFLFIYTKNKKRRVISIGKYPIVSLMEARQQALAFKKDLAEGIEPSRQIISINQNNTFNKFTYINL